jgi:hypothetical protein
LFPLNDYDSTVKIAEREAVSGTFNLPCDMGDGDVSVYAAGGLDAWVQGSCNNGVFQWINGAGKSSMSETKAIKVTVGYTYSLSAQMNIILQASDCTTFCGPGGWLSETASVSNLVARTTYKPVTSGVTLTFASGAAY